MKVFGRTQLWPNQRAVPAFSWCGLRKTTEVLSQYMWCRGRYSKKDLANTSTEHHRYSILFGMNIPWCLLLPADVTNILQLKPSTVAVMATYLNTECHILAIRFDLFI
jgi:hypothetical protein